MRNVTYSHLMAEAWEVRTMIRMTEDKTEDMTEDMMSLSLMFTGPFGLTVTTQLAAAPSLSPRSGGTASPTSDSPQSGPHQGTPHVGDTTHRGHHT